MFDEGGLSETILSSRAPKMLPRKYFAMSKSSASSLTLSSSVPLARYIATPSPRNSLSAALAPGTRRSSQIQFAVAKRGKPGLYYVREFVEEYAFIFRRRFRLAATLTYFFGERAHLINSFLAGKLEDYFLNQRGEALFVFACIESLQPVYKH